MSRLFLIPVVAGLLAIPAPGRAAVLYSNFGAGDSFNSLAAWIITGPTSGAGSNFDVAASFTPSVSAYLDSVDVALSHASGSDSVDVRITEDAGGLPDTSFLDEVTVIAPDDPAIVTASFPGLLLLSAGTTYWIWLTAPGDGDSSWYNNDQSVSGMAQSITSDETVDFGLIPENVTPAFRVNGTVIPEPVTGALLLLASLAFLRRKRVA